jgi:hypothetical protein
MLKLELSQITPYFLFFFGIVITYIGWSTKKILENIEEAIKVTSAKVDYHDHHITEILSTLKVHEFRIEELKDSVKKIEDVY